MTAPNVFFAALAVFFFCCVLLERSNTRRVVRQRDRAEHNEALLHDRCAQLRQSLAVAETRSNVVPLFRGGLDERPGRETFDPGTAS